MLWIIFSLLAALCWGIVDIADKYVLTKWFKQSITPTIIMGVIGLIASLVVYLINGFSPLSYFNIFLAIIAGIFWFLAVGVFYFKALQIGEASRVVPLFFLSNLFITLFAAVFLGEIFTTSKYLGIFLLFFSSILLTVKKFKISLDKAFWLMLLASIVISIERVLLKYILNFGDYWTVFSWERIGVLIATIPVLYFYYPELQKTVKTHGKKVIAVVSASKSLHILALLFSTIAISLGFVALANALSSVELFFVLAFTVLLSIFYPQILKEEITKSTVLLKLVAIILMFVGALLVT
jgi:transporter family protein